jgi:hypothetical protein
LQFLLAGDQRRILTANLIPGAGMPYPFDATLKNILSLRPEDCVPAFDLPRASPAQTLNVDLSTISAATDVAFGFRRSVAFVIPKGRCA